MKKYLRLYCSVCQRTVDKLVDNSRVSPDRCTITFGCQGRLFPLMYKGSGEITSAPALGITDWVARGSSTSSSDGLEEAQFINLSTGTIKQLVLAIALPSVVPAGTTAVLNLAARNDTPKDYKQYTFRFDTEFSTVSGVESAAAKKVLRFKAWGTDPDLVEVYLNGVKLKQGTDAADFQVDDGSASPPAPSNTIKFNTPILPTGTYQVDVIVSKERPADVYSLTFDMNVEDSNRTGAWDNVAAVSRFQGGAWGSYRLFTCDLAENSAALKKDTVLFPEGSVFVSGVGAVPLSNCMFMLARKPYTQVDRYVNTSIPLNMLNEDRDYVKYHTVDGELMLQAVVTSLQTFFPPLRLSKFDVENTLKTAVNGDDEQLIVDGAVIVGPDI